MVAKEVISEQELAWTRKVEALRVQTAKLGSLIESK